MVNRIERGFPVVHRHGPLLRDVAQRQVEQFEDSFIVGKRAACFGTVTAFGLLTAQV